MCSFVLKLENIFFLHDRLSVCIPFSVSIILYVRIINNLQTLLTKKQVQAVMVLVSVISVVCKYS